MNFKALNNWFQNLKEGFDIYYKSNLSNRNISTVKNDLNSISSYISELAENNTQQLNEEQKAKLQQEYIKLITSNEQLIKNVNQKEGAKLIKEALLVLNDEIIENHPTVKATLNEENKFRGAINIWLPIKYIDELGVEHQGFFNQDHLDEQNPDFAINNEVRPGFMNKRNELTYSLSKEFGLDNIISKAIPMNIIDNNNNQLSGTFMENASGHDANHLSPEDPLWKCNTDESLSNPNFLKQLADIQAFDWICANTDRSIPNTIYEIDNHDPEHPVITGVHAIDHDSSFFASITKKGQAYLAAPSDMRVISESMAEKVKNMSDEKLRGILSSHNNITEAQINAAITRKNELKDAIIKAEKLEFGSLKYYNASFKIMPDNQWKNFKMSDMVDPQKFPHKITVGRENPKNIFSRINQFTKKHELFRKEEGGKQINFSDGQLFKEDANIKREDLLAIYDIVNRNMAALNKPSDIHKNSDEFTALLSSTRNLKNTLEDIYSTTEAGQNLSKENMDSLYQKLNCLHVNANVYNSMKNNPITDMGISRLNAGKQLSQLPFKYNEIAKSINIIRNSPQYSEEKALESINAELTLIAEKNDSSLNQKRASIEQLLTDSKLEQNRGSSITNSTEYQNLLDSIDAYRATDPSKRVVLTQVNSKSSQLDNLNKIRKTAVEYMFEKIKQHAKDDYKNSLKNIKGNDFTSKEDEVYRFLENKSSENIDTMFYGKSGADRFRMAANLFNKINEISDNQNRIKTSFNEISKEAGLTNHKKNTVNTTEIKTTHYHKNEKGKN